MKFVIFADFLMAVCSVRGTSISVGWTVETVDGGGVLLMLGHSLLCRLMQISEHHRPGFLT